MRGLTGLALVGLLTAGAATATVLAGAREGTDAIGRRAAPQVVRSADLYFALNDMDAQAANLLLFGADPDFAGLRGQTLDTYELSRARADTDLQRVAEAVVGDPAGQRAVQSVIGELGRYEGRVARAQLLEEQAHAAAGKPSAEALAAYREATDLLRQRLLPAVDEVTAANAATVERIYAAQRGDLGAGWWWILVTGLLALAALGILQRVLAMRFHRLVNVPLAVTTLLTLAWLVTGLTLASRADHQLVVAKSNSYDSVIALGRARAVAYDLNADESRYLTDPARAVAYEQSFFDKTQSFARVDGAILGTYNAKLAALADTHRADLGTVGFGGFLGDELRNITFAGEQDAAERVLTAFQAYQRDDRKIRELNAQGRLKEAVTFNTGLAAGQSNADFGLLATALDDVQAINQHALDRAVAATDDDLDTATAVLGGAVLAAALALVALGVRPRLREFA
ncbi:hypothetical protein OG401_30525 [Kitasatospora purpeofusca]|uniref:hypothetical protein n=1 Tax=Kitasatospora purpeofusca TaxID=67352 RepID=UPI00225A93CA|nr:hypothetical protein [Kitasatospora purpeofusca]MCX4688582.1 hypothetical protein [Kitasatospora purpeofusca]WSR43449.1 hypothetical protein OG196_32770 [Kitasatospora purpeofusca]